MSTTLLLIMALSQSQRHPQRSWLVTSDANCSSTHQAKGEQHDLDRIAVLKEENNTQFALKIWEALVNTWDLHEGSTNLYQALRHMVYINSISACSRAGNIDLAIQVFVHLEHSQDGKPPVGIFQRPLKTYVRREIFKALRLSSRNTNVF